MLDAGAPARIPPEQLRRLRVLVVDDNPPHREILQEMLEPWCMRRPCGIRRRKRWRAGDGGAVARPIDLVLMDWKMPGMDGLSRGAKIPKHQPWPNAAGDRWRAPMAANEAMTDGGIAGIPAFLVKPVDGIHAAGYDHGRGGAERPCRPSPRRGRPSRCRRWRRPARPRILLAEDNEINQQVAVESWPMPGYWWRSPATAGCRWRPWRRVRITTRC